MLDRKPCRPHERANWFIPVIAAATFAAMSPPTQAHTQEAPSTPAAVAAAPGTLGVNLTVLKRDDWPGPARISRDLTPVKVRIQNSGHSSLLVAYDRFILNGADGRRYRALPLFRIEGADVASLKVRDPYVLGEQHFVVKNFKMAPYLRGTYRDLDAYDGSFAANPAYYSLYESYYSGKPLPTTVMRRRGIPEGIILPGGFVEGFLFFEKVKGSTRGSVVIYEAADAMTGSSLGQIRSTS